MSDEFSIHIKIDLKATTTNLACLKTLLEDSAADLDATHSYFTHETEGRNNKIHKNHLIYIVEFSHQENIKHYIEFINTIKKVQIELVCEQDKIIYMNRQYRKSLNITQQQEILERIKQSDNNSLSALCNKLLNK